MGALLASIGLFYKEKYYLAPGLGPHCCVGGRAGFGPPFVGLGSGTGLAIWPFSGLFSGLSASGSRLTKKKNP